MHTSTALSPWPFNGKTNVSTIFKQDWTCCSILSRWPDLFFLTERFGKILQESSRVFKIKIFQDSARFCRILQGSARFCKVLQDSTRFCKVLQDSARSCKILKFSAKLCKILLHDSATFSKITRFCKIG